MEQRPGSGTRGLVCTCVPRQSPSGSEEGAGLGPAAPPAAVAKIPGWAGAGGPGLEEGPAVWMQPGQDTGLRKLAPVLGWGAQCPGLEFGLPRPGLGAGAAEGLSLLSCELGALPEAWQEQGHRGAGRDRERLPVAPGQVHAGALLFEESTHPHAQVHTCKHVQPGPTVSPSSGVKKSAPMSTQHVRAPLHVRNSPCSGHGDASLLGGLAAG